MEGGERSEHEAVCDTVQRAGVDGRLDNSLPGEVFNLAATSGTTKRLLTGGVGEQVDNIRSMSQWSRNPRSGTPSGIGGINLSCHGPCRSNGCGGTL